MRFEELDEGDALRIFGQEMWNFIVGLGTTIDQPAGTSGEHLARLGDSLFLTFRFVGERALKFPKHSLVLQAKWSESFREIEGIKRGEATWFHAPSAELGVQPSERAKAEQFIRLAHSQNQ